MSDTTNHPHYDATLAHAKELGGDFRSAMRRKRKLAVSLISAAHVEAFALEPLIVDTKKAMSFAKLDKADQNQAAVFFTALRTISGAWPTLAEDVRTAFLAGEKIYSTLAKEIKDAEKKAAEAPEPAAKAEPEPEAAPEPAPVPEPEAAPVDPIVAMMRALGVFVDETPMEKMSAEQLAALSNLADAIDEFRASAKAKAAAPLANAA